MSEQRPRVAMWTAGQTPAFLHALRGHRWYLLFHLIALFGLRRAEAAGLRWSDVVLEAGYLTVCRQLRHEHADRQ